MRKKKKESGQSLEIRQRRVFSEAFKRQKVSLLITKQISVGELSEVYKINRSTVYRWLYRYSPHYEQGVTQVVQMESEATKLKGLLLQIRELEQLLGRKQVEIEYLEALIGEASESLGVDIKKNFATRP